MTLNLIMFTNVNNFKHDNEHMIMALNIMIT